MVAVQAQDPAAVRWAVGLRMGGAAVEADVHDALAGEVLRTHLFRGTWQLVTPGDVRWLLALVAPRVLARASRRFRELGLDPATLRRSEQTIARALGGRHPTRAELSSALLRAKIATGPRLSHLLWHAELQGILTSGVPRAGRPTYASLDERAPPGPLPDREAALAELARRYFESRGPATDDDFAWWSGLPPADARRGRAASSSALASLDAGGQSYWLGATRLPSARKTASVRQLSAHLLPGFDEYLVAYRDRDAVLDPAVVARINAGGGMLNPVVVIDGLVRGTWRRTLARDHVAIEIDLFAPLSPAADAAVEAAARRYASFLGREPRLVRRGPSPGRPRRG
jgi:hypothetical protein